MGARGRARARTQVHRVSVPTATTKGRGGGDEWDPEVGVTGRGETIMGVLGSHLASTLRAPRGDVGVSEAGTCTLGRIVQSWVSS